MKLWRLESFAPHAIQRPETLAGGMQLHLTQATLMTVEMRVGEQSRAYLGLAPCSGCDTERCIPGCHSDLFRRLLRASIPTVTFAPLNGGLAQRSYARAYLARPRPGARPLILPDGCSEARLSIVYQKRSAVALLLVGADSPDLVTHAQSAKWQAWPLPAPLLKWAAAPIPPTPSVAGGVLDKPLFFAMSLGPYPAVAVRPVSKPGSVFRRQKRDAKAFETASSVEPDVPHILAPPVLPDEPPALLARLISLALHAPQTDGGVAVGSSTRALFPNGGSEQREGYDAPDEQDRWPAGPDAMLPGHVEHVITALLGNGEVRDKGVTRKILKGLAPTQEMALFVWFDNAGLFTEPHNTSDPAQRWRERRRLSSDDVEVIAERLAKTLLPDMQHVAAATQLLGGSS